MQVFVDSVRLDKWLWAARFFKSRTLAVSAIDTGRVLVNNERAKPARLIKVGERLKISREQERFELVVKGISEQRKSAPLARLLYEETPESLLTRQTAAENRRFYSEPSQDIAGRPTKRNRRALERWRDN
ncbi:RNA-binding S4 domain-containing protein [Zwartia vadi]|uniref:RNA-binding S4 domain-containing protein n=1 Tax=Zwartia vadi TaxID=3058168 RepID=UPI0025B62820|nr:S4 domain-containing protein [Zwartia vadi]MDN3986377.1 S4 domain-containing protein [Zwartia vadi]